MNPKRNQEIDRLFQEKLGSHDSALPNDFWDRMQVERASRSKQISRNRMIWLLLFLFVSTAGYRLFYNKKDPNRQAVVLQNTILQTQEQSNPTRIAALDLPNHSELKNKLSNNNMLLNSAENIGTTSEDKNKHTEEALGALFVQKKQAHDKSIHKTLKDRVILQEKTDHHIKTNITASSSKHLSSRSIAGERASISNEIPASLSEQVNNKNAHNNVQTTPSSHKGKVGDLANRQPRPASLLKETATETDLSQHTLSFLKTSYKPLASSKKTDEKLDVSIHNCPDFIIKRYKTYLEFVFAPEFAVRNLSTNQAALNEYIGIRNQTERSNYAFHTGGRIAIAYKSGIVLKTGMLYSQISEHFQHRNNETITEKRYELIEEIPSQDDPGRMYQVWDTVTYVYKGQRVRNYFNRHHSIDVPLMIGYEKRFHGFSVAVNAGVNLNLWFASKSTFFSPEMEPLNYSTDNISGQVNLDNLAKGKTFKSTVGINLFTSFACNYRISSRSYLIFEPSFRMHLNSFTLPETGIDQSYIIPGVIFGLRYELN